MSINTIPICDLHCDTAMNLAAGADLNDLTMQVNLPFMKQAGIALQVFACYLPSSIPAGSKFPLLESMLDRLEQNISQHAEEIVICTNSHQVAKAGKDGKIAAVLAVENGMSIENDLKNLERLYERGVRLLTIVHARSSNWVISSNDSSPAFAGLSDFGKEVIKLMNDLGMLIDVSHSHDHAVQKILALSKAPIVASHSCVRALCPMPRNLSDDLIKGIAESGGVIGLNFFPGFLDANYSKICEARAGELFSELSRREEQAGTDLPRMVELFTEFSRQFSQIMQDVPVSIDRLMDHLDYISNLAGEDCLCFGSDFDGIPDLPQGLCDCRGFPAVKERMESKGCSNEQIHKISWDNFMRVFKAVCG
jgi:membrane dipeptidase